MSATLIPATAGLDSTRAFLSEGYTFVSTRCEVLQSDVFRTRLMLREAVCALGEDAAQTFYSPGRFTREGALPPTTLMLLQDRGSVQLMDGGAHRRRKEMFMSFMSPDQVAALGRITAEEWRKQLARWSREEHVMLFPEVEAVLCRAACRWAGVPLDEAAAVERTREFHAMIDGAGAVGVRTVRGLFLRSRTERWMRDVIGAVRAGRMRPADHTPLSIIAKHLDEDGQVLDRKVAAVEMLNVLRPTVAVARYVVFAALALHEQPALRALLAQASDDEVESFVHEVRRYYPFFPVVGGRVKQPFEWRGHRFQAQDWMLLDLYGTTHDRRIWDEPQHFQADRFVGKKPDPFTLIPQGGGAHAHTHRCAGEWATIEVMKTTSKLLTEMQYRVPDQDLTIDLNRMPAIPRSRFVMKDVHDA